MSGPHHYLRATLIGGVLVVLPLFVFANLLLLLARWIFEKISPVAELTAGQLGIPLWSAQVLTIGAILVACSALGAFVEHTLRQSRVQLDRKKHSAARAGVSPGQRNRRLS